MNTCTRGEFFRPVRPSEYRVVDPGVLTLRTRCCVAEEEFFVRYGMFFKNLRQNREEGVVGWR